MQYNGCIKKKKNIFTHHLLGHTREFYCYYFADFGHVSNYYEYKIKCFVTKRLEVLKKLKTFQTLKMQ